MFCGWGGMGWGSLPSYEGSGLKLDGDKPADLTGMRLPS